MDRTVQSGREAARILDYGIRELRLRPEKFYVVDTNVLLSDSAAIKKLQDGLNAVVVPLLVLAELDTLKHTKPMLASQISMVVKDMNQRQHEGDPYFYIAQGDISTYADLDPNHPDHHVIATYLAIEEQYCDIPIIIISNDCLMHTLALCLGVKIQEYQANRADTSVLEHNLPFYPTLNFFANDKGQYEIPDQFEFSRGDVPENGGVVLVDKETSFVYIREGQILRPISGDISAMGISPYTILPETTNWEMYLALEQLLNRGKEFVSLIGKAGTGKTLAAIAVALKLAIMKKYQTIMIARPFVLMGDRKDNLGALPGGLEEKTEPWLKPIYDNLEFLANLSGENKKAITKLQEEGRLEVLPFYHARGRTLNGVYLIVDEAQNLTHDDMITIGSRAGQGSKVVVTGDIDQIDIHPRDKQVNALAHAAIDLMGEDNCATTYLTKPVRSRLAEQIANRLRRS